MFYLERNPCEWGDSGLGRNETVAQERLGKGRAEGWGEDAAGFAASCKVGCELRKAAGVERGGADSLNCHQRVSQAGRIVQTICLSNVFFKSRPSRISVAPRAACMNIDPSLFLPYHF
jgi:hypothetical protein